MGWAKAFTTVREREQLSDPHTVVLSRGFLFFPYFEAQTVGTVYTLCMVQSVRKRYLARAMPGERARRGRGGVMRGVVSLCGGSVWQQIVGANSVRKRGGRAQRLMLGTLCEMQAVCPVRKVTLWSRSPLRHRPRGYGGPIGQMTLEKGYHPHTTRQDTSMLPLSAAGVLLPLSRILVFDEGES